MNKFFHKLEHEALIIIGALIALLALFNVSGLTNLNSDLFWLLAGIGLCVEGWLYMKRKVNKK